MKRLINLLIHQTKITTYSTNLFILKKLILLVLSIINDCSFLKIIFIHIMLGMHLEGKSYLFYYLLKLKTFSNNNFVYVNVSNFFISDPSKYNSIRIILHFYSIIFDCSAVFLISIILNINFKYIITIIIYY